MNWNEAQKFNSEEDSEKDFCVGCEHLGECQLREEDEPHIFEMQFNRCLAKGEPVFEDDNYWVDQICGSEES